MARPDLVPPLADTLDVIGALTPDELERCWIWVATPRHVEKAAAAGASGREPCRVHGQRRRPSTGSSDDWRQRGMRPPMVRVTCSA
jgi:hydroxymethylglutaryl-CoA lyase